MIMMLITMRIVMFPMLSMLIIMFIMLIMMLIMMLSMLKVLIHMLSMPVIMLIMLIIMLIILCIMLLMVIMFIIMLTVVFLPNSERCKVSSGGQDVRAHRCHRGVRSAAGEVPGDAGECRQPLFFLKPTSKVEKKCRQLHRKRTSMSKTK